jgi:CCR4-NOT transcriptional complex subunit CAF120
LVRGKIEGWARVRIAGQTDWKKFWVVVQEGAEGIDHVPTGPERANGAAGPATLVKKNRMSSIFSSKDSPPASSLPPKPIISMFLSPKPKDRRKPALSISSVSQAYAMYPDRPELISKSTLIKIEGTFGDEETAAALRLREGWASIMPELENNTGQAAEILKWVVGM